MRLPGDNTASSVPLIRRLAAGTYWRCQLFSPPPARYLPPHRSYQGRVRISDLRTPPHPNHIPPGTSFSPANFDLHTPVDGAVNFQQGDGVVICFVTLTCISLYNDS